MRYASQTEISCERSRAEIETLLDRYGANKFAYGKSDGMSVIGFIFRGRSVRFNLPLPLRDEDQFSWTPGRRKKLSPEAQYKVWEQACRQRWRALALVIKAKLEAVECGITTFDEEFLSHFVLPGGETIGQYVIPKLESVYGGKEVELLPGPMA